MLMETAVNLANWFLLFIIYSFIGWALEVALGLVIEKRHKPVNRGFLIGPICPIYGFGAIIMTLIVGKADGVLEIFCVCFLSGAIIEYLTSYIMEKLFHVRWWDYSDKAFNVNGRICLQCLIMFGILGVLAIKILNPLTFGLLNNIPEVPRLAIAIIVFIIMLADILISLWLIIKCRVTVGTSERDATEEITENVRKVMMEKGKLNRRLAKAFPDMQAKKKTPRKKTSRAKTASKTKTTSSCKKA